RVLELLRDRQRLGERLVRALEPRPLLGGAEREQEIDTGAVARRARPLPRTQGAAVVLSRLLPRQQPVGAPPRGEREVDRPLRALDRRGAAEVERELRQPGVEVVALARQDRLPDARVQPRASQAREAVVER